MVDTTPKVMVAVPTGELGRHTAFWDYFNLLIKPDGTVCTAAHGQSPAKGRNSMIEAALEHDCTHILFIDDDMIFPPDGLMRLLAHDLDIVSGYYLMRQFPHQGLIFDYKDDDGKNHWYEVKDDESGLKEVVSTGLGFCLFKLHVFETLEKPYVRLGEIEADGWCDDIGLFNRIREKGFKIHVDLDIQCGHIGTMTVRPIKKDGIWQVEIGTFTTETVTFPMIRTPEKKVAISSEERRRQIYVRLAEILKEHEMMESNIPIKEVGGGVHEYWALKRELNGLSSPA